MQNKGITFISIHFRPEFEIVSYQPCSLGGRGGGGFTVLRLMFAGYVPLASRSPYPNIVTFYLCIYLTNMVSSGGM